ncbi:MAG: peptidyl-prolyl cis-trans isomerase [Terriglobales bacterium]
MLHFVLLGAALFATFHFLRPAPEAAPSSKQIQLSLDELAQLAVQFQSQWRRDPTPEEFSRMVEQKVQSEVLYREGLALSLDKYDEIVKRRMAQKMQFLAEDMAAAREPATDELKNWFAANSAKFSLPPRLSLRHLYFSPDRRANSARDDAVKVMAQLAGQPEDTRAAEGVADPFMFQDYYRDRAPDFLGKEFGSQFARAVASLAPGSWQGPIESGFGWHLVFVDTVIPGRVPAFEEIESDVKTAWFAEQKALAWEKAYRDIRAKYTVLVPGQPEGTNTAAPSVAGARAAASDSSNGSAQ